MEKDQIKEKLNQIVDPYKEKQQLYEVMDLLGLKYRRTNCKSCIIDYYHICMEELEMISDASEASDWDTRDYELIYNYPRPVNWKGKIVKKSSPREVHEAFYVDHPQFYIKQLKLQIDENNN